MDGILPPDQETFSIIHDESLRLNRLIEDLRTLSLADAGELPLMIRPTAPADLIERTLLAHKPLADDIAIALECEIASNLPLIAVDADRIAQVLDNLVSNALRYTSQGGRVLLKSEQVGDKLLITVEDDGEGISADALPHIFERFYRGDASRQRDGSGSGLGLAISRSIVQQHGGDITVTSDSGTQFTIALPILHNL
jgi:signal transduction histidine kinase